MRPSHQLVPPARAVQPELTVVAGPAKFVEAMAFSSWGFLLLGSPMMVAYGITVDAPWSFYAIFLAFLLAFVLIPGSVGGLGAIAVANFLPRRRKTVLAVGLAGMVLLGVAVVARLLRTSGESGTPAVALTCESGSARAPVQPANDRTRHRGEGRSPC